MMSHRYDFSREHQDAETVTEAPVIRGMTPRQVFDQNDGTVTQSYYDYLNSRGPLGEIGCALFRAQKRSSRAKDYRGRQYRTAAYRVKEWSLAEVCRLLKIHGDDLGFKWGWKQDPSVLFGDKPSFVLYVDLPNALGQVSFHSPSRTGGPDYDGEWDGVKGASEERIIAFCEQFAFCEATA